VTRVRKRCIGLVLLALLTLGVQACVANNLQHVGYVGANKVWYHWARSDGTHSLIVCDVHPDGSETNCQETEI
jgi:hypothetical protein